MMPSQESSVTEANMILVSSVAYMTETSFYHLLRFHPPCKGAIVIGKQLIL